MKKHFEYLLKFLAQHGTLETVEGIVLVIAKWDGKPEDIEAEANVFLQRSYLSLINLCEDFVEEYDLSFHVYKFSLGDFEPNGMRYRYVPDDSEEIYHLLCETTTAIERSGKKKKKKRRFW